MGATILVADDDRAIRMVLNQALARLGHDVRLTGNAATLWRWVADGEGDLVITDVIMPDENGLDLIPRIKKVRPELRVIVMSAQSTLLTAVKATERSMGRFEQARGGTLFLDEIGDMPPEAQTRLLRVLQDGEYTAVGGRVPIRANTRIIAATHRDLSQLIRQGQFRDDLFYRLNVAPIRLPPLRERSSDIPPLVRHFAALAAKEGLPVKTIDDLAMQRLQQYRWPGNVRELENLVRRLAALYPQEVIGLEVIEAELVEGPPAEMPAEARGGEGLSSAVQRHINDYFAAHKGDLPAAGLYDRILREIERPLIVATLGATRGNQIKAAHLLGLNRNTLRKKIRELDIPVVRGLK